MPLMPSPKPPLFIKAVKDICSINTFEKLPKLWSKLLTFRLYNTIVSIWIIKAVSPLTTRIWVVFSIPARRPWGSNSLSIRALAAGRQLASKNSLRVPLAFANSESRSWITGLATSFQGIWQFWASRTMDSTETTSLDRLDAIVKPEPRGNETWG